MPLRLLAACVFALAPAAAFAQIDYSHGFVKRGLLGTVYAEFGLRQHAALATISYILFLFLLAIFILLTRKSGIEERTGSVAVVAMFTSSYVFTFLAHLNGYTDIVLAGIAMLLLLVRSPLRRFCIGLPLIVIALLIHEGFLILFFPVVLLSFVVDAACEANRKDRQRTLIYMSLLTLVTFGTTLAVVFLGRISPNQVALFHSEILARADFTPREEFFTVLNASVADNFHLSARRLLDLRWYGAALLAICLLGPTLIGLLSFCRKLLARFTPKSASGRTKIVTISALIALLAPECMNLLGIDSMRWHVLTAFVAYLILLTLSMRLPPGRLPISPAGLRFIGFVIALNLAGGFGLYDHMVIRPFPFFPALFRGF